MFLAHTKENGEQQELKVHLENVAALAKGFADAFGNGTGEVAYQMGLAHDLGKYSDKFQARIRGEDSSSVDHSTAGGRALYNLGNTIGAYGVMGHHSGLMNGGSRRLDTGREDKGAFFVRYKKRIENYDAYQKEITLVNNIDELEIESMAGVGFSVSILTRMLYSTLVDADFLDTEVFMADSPVPRGGYDSIEVLYQRYSAYVQRFNSPKTPIHQKRNEILANCLEKGEEPRGLYSLTVPTGGGKTISSLGFALKHAKLHGLDRVIYLIPYTSIIEQTAQVIGEIVGPENVLEHHSSVYYNSEENHINRNYLATENWDAPIIVTTNVQFFESLFACRSSKCRKLHRIANSVLIFDEIQMIPTSYLLPCIMSIGELVKNYRATAVLCTATQPALDSFFMPKLKRKEICTDPQALYEFFKRATITPIGQLKDEELVARLQAEEQVLCIVNSRKQAQNLYQMLGEGYHLSTLMTPMHRKEVLAQIRKALQEGRPCRVISTSLVEAGVDLDFPTVYRAKNGLDSIIQAAGRCNREGKNPPEESRVYVFEEQSEYALPSVFRQPTAGFDEMCRRHQELDNVATIHDYFHWLYVIKKNELDQNNVIESFNYGWGDNKRSLPFKDVRDRFRLIDQNTYPIFIPIGPEAQDLDRRINQGERSRELLRAIGRYSVNVYEQHLNTLWTSGVVEFMDDKIALKAKDGLFVLRNLEAYSDKQGLTLEPETGVGLFI